MQTFCKKNAKRTLTLTPDAHPSSPIRQRQYWLLGVALDLFCFQENVEASVEVLPGGVGGGESEVSVFEFANLLQKNASYTLTPMPIHPRPYANVSTGCLASPSTSFVSRRMWRHLWRLMQIGDEKAWEAEMEKFVRGSLFSVFYVPGGPVEPADSTSRFFLVNLATCMHGMTSINH